jgi:2-oxo-4-hydroxy-4-carboxy-5-ureidoimidazoline decarboxylase
MAEINSLPREQFVARLGFLFEYSPWVAERAWPRGPFASAEDLHAAMADEADHAGREEVLALLRAHPDLGTRAKMSAASTGEQAGAGLGSMPPDEFDRLHNLNGAYRRKFGFPFLYAVKGSTSHDILDALEQRLNSTPDAEFQEALRQVHRIAWFRLQTLLNQED